MSAEIDYEPGKVAAEVLKEYELDDADVRTLLLYCRQFNQHNPKVISREELVSAARLLAKDLYGTPKTPVKGELSGKALEKLEWVLNQAYMARNAIEKWWGDTFDGVLVLKNHGEPISKTLVPAWLGFRGEMWMANIRIADGHLPMTHEMTHAFAPNGARMLAEGLAVYTQAKFDSDTSAFPNGKQTLHLLAHQAIQTAPQGLIKKLDQIPSPNLLELEQEGLIERMCYTVAGSFLTYLIDSYSEDLVENLELFRKLYVKTPLLVKGPRVSPEEWKESKNSRVPINPNRWEEVYKKTIDQLEEEWRNWLKRTHPLKKEVPAAPTDLAVSFENGQPELTFEFPDLATSYKIYQADGDKDPSNGSYEVYTPSNDRFFGKWPLKNVQPGHTYTFGIAGIASGIEGPPATILVQVPDVLPRPTLTAPLGLRVRPRNENELEVRWERSAAAVSYNLFSGKTKEDLQSSEPVTIKPESEDQDAFGWRCRQSDERRFFAVSAVDANGRESDQAGPIEEIQIDGMMIRM